MPIAADILARATHDMADPRKRTTAKLGCSCCAIYLWLRLSHPITVLGDYRTHGLLSLSLRKNAAHRILPDQVPIDPLWST